jgi:outer membrane lipoprotein-sorting protein
MRWQYITPTPLVIMANGSQIVYYDKELDQTSYLPVRQTPAGVLLKEHISLSEDTNITVVENKSGILRISLENKDDTQKGSITFEFSNTPFMLNNLFIKDEVGNLTSINLVDARYGDPIDHDMFSRLNFLKWNNKGK